MNSVELTSAGDNLNSGPTPTMVTPLLFALLVPLAAEEPPTKVCTGGVVFAECFGFNATDGTAALQVRPHWFSLY